MKITNNLEIEFNRENEDCNVIVIIMNDYPIMSLPIYELTDSNNYKFTLPDLNNVVINNKPFKSFFTDKYKLYEVVEMCLFNTAVVDAILINTSYLALATILTKEYKIDGTIDDFKNALLQVHNSISYDMFKKNPRVINIPMGNNTHSIIGSSCKIEKAFIRRNAKLKFKFDSLEATLHKNEISMYYPFMYYGKEHSDTYDKKAVLNIDEIFNTKENCFVSIGANMRIEESIYEDYLNLADANRFLCMCYLICHFLTGNILSASEYIK